MLEHKSLLSGHVMVDKLLKGGQEGEVYRSFEYRANAVRAVKVKNRGSQFDMRPLREVENLKRLRCEHVVRFFQTWVDPWDSRLYLLTEYCNGGDLEDFVHRHAPVSKELLCDLMVQLLMGLTHVHAHCIFHRDIKLGNILLHDPDKVEVVRRSNNDDDADVDAIAVDDEEEQDGAGERPASPAACCAPPRGAAGPPWPQRWVVKIADFGCSKSVSSQGDLSYHSHGTAVYFSPEMIRGQAYSLNTDVWSLGVCLYAVMSGGTLPFHSDSEEALRELIGTHQPPHPSSYFGYPTELGDLVMEMLTKAAVDRPGAAELLARPALDDAFRRLAWTDVPRLPGAAASLASLPGGVALGLPLMMRAKDVGVNVRARPDRLAIVTHVLRYGAIIFVHPLVMVSHVNELGTDRRPAEQRQLNPCRTLWCRVLHPCPGYCVLGYGSEALFHNLRDLPPSVAPKHTGTPKGMHRDPAGAPSSTSPSPPRSGGSGSRAPASRHELGMDCTVDVKQVHPQLRLLAEPKAWNAWVALGQLPSELEREKKQKP